MPSAHDFVVRNKATPEASINAPVKWLQRTEGDNEPMIPMGQHQLERKPLCPHKLRETMKSDYRGWSKGSRRWARCLVSQAWAQTAATEVTECQPKLVHQRLFTLSKRKRMIMIRTNTGGHQLGLNKSRENENIWGRAWRACAKPQVHHYALLQLAAGNLSFPTLLLLIFFNWERICSKPFS